jgi:phosphate transport system substrate-binding protein
MKMKIAVQTAVVAIALTVFGFGNATAETRIVGSGASFPYPIYSIWFKQFSSANKDIRVNYQSKGSGAGIRDFIAGVVDFAASDAAMNEKEMAQVEGGVQLLPMTAGKVVLAYNLKGVKELKLPREIYPAIFLGKVKKWNDPMIAKANPGVKLPDEEITVVTRADSSGTTYVFTKHLSEISDEFKSTVGVAKAPNWAGGVKMVKSPKNDGVTATIKQTPGAIGYIEYGFARMSKLAMASLENKEGKFVAPTLESGQAALAKAEIPENMIVWLPDPSGADSYPIATYTWMIFHKKYDDPKKAEALRMMVNFCLDEGQKIADKAGYIPLPPNVVEKVRMAAGNIQ